MELHTNGSIKSSSVRELKRVALKPKENETIKYRLARARTHGKVQIGEIAVLGERQWLRVKPSEFNGMAWIEII